MERMYEEGRDNRTRALLFDYIKDHPGISFVFLREAFRLNEGTLRYHLDYLERKDKIVLEKVKGKKCYFTTLKKQYPLLDDGAKLNKHQRRILDLVSSEPGISYSNIRKRIRLENGPFKYYMKGLKSSKLIWKVKNDQGYGYEIVTKERISEEIFLVLVERFLDQDLGNEEFRDLMDKLDRYKKEK